MERRIKPANGVTGIIIFNGVQPPVFRVYGNKEKGEIEHIDYEIAHSDLQVTIQDTDATFYEHAGGDINFLDHSPETLGYKKE